MITNDRNLAAELQQGIAEMQQHRAKKMTLRTHHLDAQQRPQVDASVIRQTREALHMSQQIFARKLRVSSRTLQKWEQGETVPNDQAAALILMVRKYPDTLKRLESL